ncbi:hypothetical protein [Aeromonas diversa]|uniref:hypothetical protein n=1 Tax=Aeromonas diversa TaxID=502790 RepID=UPI003462FE1A
MSRYVFLLKGEQTIPQSLDEPEAGAILVSLLRQGFRLDPRQHDALDARAALAWLRREETSLWHRLRASERGAHEVTP